MLTTFFGGISRWSWNNTASAFEPSLRVGDKTQTVYFDGLQWIDQITTLMKGSQGTREVVQTSRLPGNLGTNAV